MNSKAFKDTKGLAYTRDISIKNTEAEEKDPFSQEYRYKSGLREIQGAVFESKTLILPRCWAFWDLAQNPHVSGSKHGPLPGLIASPETHVLQRFAGLGTENLVLWTYKAEVLVIRHMKCTFTSFSNSCSHLKSQLLSLKILRRSLGLNLEFP